jgi:hypothetical protein
MTKLICIAGLPCTGKTTLGINLAKNLNCLSLDLEHLRSVFLESDIKNNVLRFTYNEPIKPNESLRDYFLRCVIYDRVLDINEYVEWYKFIMQGVDGLINSILIDFDALEYSDFIRKHTKVINYQPASKPSRIILNHALLSLVEVWNRSFKILLTCSDDKIISRFINREGIIRDDASVNGDIIRHVKMYKIINDGAKWDIFYDTTDKFCSVKKFKELYEIWGNV